MNTHTKNILAGLLGVLVGTIFMSLATGALGNIISSLPTPHSHNTHGGHSHTSGEDAVHVHADWKMVINGEHIRFVDEKYQSITGDVQHNDIHLHDYEDYVIHRHADGVTFVDFLNSIGYDLIDMCLTNDFGKTFCNENENEVRLIVNSERMMDINGYIIQEEDRILVYYGDVTDPALRDYVASVTDEACLYSGTCLERGYKTTSTCGITCEIE
ncbi:MAG: hypothetical protein ACK42D_00290 [Candidatus Paceibacteria bacterium]